VAESWHPELFLGRAPVPALRWLDPLQLRAVKLKLRKAADAAAVGWRWWPLWGLRDGTASFAFATPQNILFCVLRIKFSLFWALGNANNFIDFGIC
jgi:hypothetical protein